MNQAWVKRLADVEVAEPYEAGALQAFGLRWNGLPAREYLTLDEALAGQTLEVTEINQQGAVPLLQVVNRGKTMVFLMAGEQLIGAKQNRVLNTSLMVGAQSTLPVPVSCVEAGRWRYQSPKFASDGTMAHGALRKLMCGHVDKSYRSGGMAAADQTEVWGEVAGKLSKMGSASPTRALHQVYEDFERPLERLLQDLPAPPGCAGAVFAVGGRLAGADLFDSPHTLARLWPKLVRSFALDALEPGVAKARASAPEARRWLAGAAESRARAYPAPGLGKDVRLEAPGLLGAGLVIDGEPAHVQLFAP